MSPSVVYEALAVGFKEGLKVGIVWLVVRSFLIGSRQEHLRAAFAAGLGISAVLSVLLLFLPHHLLIKEQVGNSIHLSFVIFLLASVGALLNASGVRVFGFLDRMPKNGYAVRGLAFAASILFFLPDQTGTAVFLGELAALTEKATGTGVSAVFGLAIAGGVAVVAVRRLSARLVASFFDVPQLLLFLAIVKLFGGGVEGFAEVTLIPSLQRGLMKFSHDAIHQVFVFLMVPDHPLLKATVWNFVGFFFGSNIALWESLLLLLFFPLLFIVYSLTRPVPELEADSGAGRRRTRYLILSDRRRKAIPVIFFVAMIVVVWFSQGGESVSQLYVPKPKPVVADKGLVMIPLNDPTMDLRDGAMHTFVLVHNGKEIRLLVMQRPDNRLAVCLDACEICEPDGYGQRDDHVICIYCNTPIPVATLGEPGGCNPIPLAATVDEKFIRIELNEIARRWAEVNSGKMREGMP